MTNEARGRYIALEPPGELMTKRDDILPASLSPRGVCREEAARFIGISPSKFDVLVADGRMPKAKVIDGRKVWDTHALGLAFDALPDDAGGNGKTENPWDGVT